MSASKNRIDWALLILRLAVGLMALLHGLESLHQSGIPPTLTHLSHAGYALLLGLLEVVCGGLMIVGVWMLPSALGIIVLIALPGFHGWTHGVLGVGSHQSLFRIFATFASALGGSGKLSLSK